MGRGLDRALRDVAIDLFLHRSRYGRGVLPAFHIEIGGTVQQHRSAGSGLRNGARAVGGFTVL